MLLEGTQAPSFALQGSDGNVHTLDVYAGKTLVIYFYPRDNTPGCTKEACGFRDMNRELAGMGVIVVGVSKDSLASHEKFIRSQNLPFVLLSDPDASVMTAYGAYGEKLLYGKKTTGIIRSTVVIGPNGMVLKHWPKVAKADQHPAQVLSYLQQQV